MGSIPRRRWTARAFASWRAPLGERSPWKRGYPLRRWKNWRTWAIRWKRLAGSGAQFLVGDRLSYGRPKAESCGPAATRAPMDWPCASNWSVIIGPFKVNRWGNQPEIKRKEYNMLIS